MIRYFSRFFRAFNWLEKVIATALLIVIGVSLGQMAWAFYKDSSDVIPARGGEYKEGLVGTIRAINPVLSFASNEVDSDISRLVFSGLMKYNPLNAMLENDIASHTLSENKLVYTFTLKEGAKWHDGTDVSSDDIIYTFQTVIQSPQFANAVLHEAFQNVTIAQVDERSVTFSLKKPYKFFLANLTVGLLPKHILEFVPVENLHLSEFNLDPVGTGPYKFSQMIEDGEVPQVQLEIFDEYYGEKPYVERILVDVFPSYDELMARSTEMNGFRVYGNREDIALMGRYTLFDYTLPQYVALFFNTKRDILKNPKIRLGLQLATNKQEIVDAIGEKEIIDTPLLEINRENWVYQFDPSKAAGAFSDSEWKIPGKDYKKAEEEAPAPAPAKPKELALPSWGEDDASNIVTHITEPNEGKNWVTNESKFYITGTNPEGTKGIVVNDYRLQLFSPEKGTWSFHANANIGSLKEGENVFTIFAINESDEKKELDTIKIFYISDKDQYEKTLEKLKEPPTEGEEQPEPEEEEVPVEEDEKVENFEGVIRVNSKGDELRLTVVTKESPAFYQTIAEKVREQWRKVGVDIELLVLNDEQFAERVMKRDYDVLLFGQNLGYNLDAYTYWHSSQIGETGVNLSEYTSLGADALIEEIRATHNEDKRQKSLGLLQEQMGKDTPAIFLYSPLYSYAVSTTVNDVAMNRIGIHSDRFNAISDWFITQGFVFKDSAAWYDFFGWALEQF